MDASSWAATEVETDKKLQAARETFEQNIAPESVGYFGIAKESVVYVGRFLSIIWKAVRKKS